MHKNCSNCFLLFVLFLFSATIYGATHSYSGFWVTYDGKSPLPRSIVKFTQKNNQVTGKNFLMFYTTDQPEKICKKCKGPYYHRNLIGLPIFKGHLNPKKIKQPCKIYNAGDGRHYSCYFLLSENGKMLTIRVYVGIPLFGRTLHWHRFPPKKLASFHGKRWVRLNRPIE